jgi:hypothetical protein
MYVYSTHSTWVILEFLLTISIDTSWEKRPATPTQRNNLWRVTRRTLVNSDDKTFLNSSFQEVMQMDADTRPKYFAMEHVFWVRVSIAYYITL